MLNAKMSSENIIIRCFPGQKIQYEVQMLNNGSVSWPVSTIFARQYLSKKDKEGGLIEFQVEGNISPG